MSFFGNIGKKVVNASAQIPGINRGLTAALGQNVETYYCKDKKSSDATYTSKTTGVMCKKKEKEKDNNSKSLDGYEFKCFNDQSDKTLITDDQNYLLNYITEFNEKNGDSRCRYIPSKLETVAKYNPIGAIGAFMASSVEKEGEIKTFEQAQAVARSEFFENCNNLLQLLNTNQKGLLEKNNDNIKNYFDETSTSTDINFVEMFKFIISTLVPEKQDYYFYKMINELNENQIQIFNELYKNYIFSSMRSILTTKMNNLKYIMNGLEDNIIKMEKDLKDKAGYYESWPKSKIKIEQQLITEKQKLESYNTIDNGNFKSKMDENTDFAYIFKIILNNYATINGFFRTTYPMDDRLILIQQNYFKKILNSPDFNEKYNTFLQSKNTDKKTAGKKHKNKKTKRTKKNNKTHKKNKKTHKKNKKTHKKK